MELAKAYLCQQGNESKKVEFSFNPTTVKFSKSAQFEPKITQSAKKSPPKTFKGTGPTELSLQVLLDDSQKAGGSVTPAIEQLLGWLQPTPESAKSPSPSPPNIVFSWGKLKIGSSEKFVGHLESVSVNCKLFAPDGSPTRAEVDLKLKDLPDDPKNQNPTSGGVTTHRIHSLHIGETVHSVAYGEYGDAALWRGVAEVNDVDDPFRMRPGTQLLLPKEADLRAGVGQER
jgi:nucleoid-associated protein YgaU